MVVRDLYLVCSIILPNEANTILIIDSDTVLTLPVTCQSFQMIARWHTKIVQINRCLNLIELAKCNLFNRSPATILPSLKELLCAVVFETLDH